MLIMVGKNLRNFRFAANNTNKYLKKVSGTDPGLHVLYKRAVARQEFCGLESTITSAELTEDENGVTEDVYATGQRLTEEGELIVSYFEFFGFVWFF